MAKANRTPRVLEEVVAPQIETPAEAHAEAMAVLEIDQQIALSNSKVKPKYKVAYKMRAIEAGLRGKAAKRSNGDWLAQTMAKLVLTEKEKLDLDKFEALCAANGVDTNRWPNRNKGWEGRLRMTACLVLRKIVADNEVLHTPEGDLVPPMEFVNKNRSAI